MHIFIYGPPGTGKSTIGRIIARSLKLPFVDLDRVIEEDVDMPISEIMERLGESTFRDLETAALNATAGHALSVTVSQDKVIALGGGALLRAENRAYAENRGRIIVLMADADTLFQRLHASPTKRPLLAGDLKSKLTSLLERRREHYDSFPLKMDVGDETAGQNAHRAQVLLGRHHLSSMGEYDVITGQASSLTNFPMQNPIIITDNNVAKLHLAKVASALQAAGHSVNTVILPAGEENKNLELVSHMWKDFLEHGLDRRSTVIALGGGVVSDMAGFAASTYMRGIDWITIPTTLLAMVDAALGGKTGIDLPEGKNLVGSFHPPKLVIADPGLLLTLSDREMRSGMAEVVKHGIISDPELFEICSRGMDWAKHNLEEIVKRAMAVKIRIIEEDPFEKGIRAALNLGHTVGHAVEHVSGFTLSHGEAVSIGTAVEARYAVRVGVAVQGLEEAIAGTLSGLGLPVNIPNELPPDKIIQTMRLDKKKNATSIRFALPVEIGRVELVDVDNPGIVLDD